MNLSSWTFRWKWGPTGEAFSGEGQPPICAVGIAGLSLWVARKSSEMGSLLVSSDCSCGPLTPRPPVAPGTCCSISSQSDLFKEGCPQWLFLTPHSVSPAALWLLCPLHHWNCVWPTSAIAHSWLFSPCLYGPCRIWLWVCSLAL